MGCDIHCYVETKQPDGWRYRGDVPYYGNRNYDVFAMLADVRNDESYVPINPVRGLPSDISADVAAESAEWGSEAHSHSYATLHELLYYHWNYSTKKTGIVDAGEFLKWKQCGKPVTYCQGVIGRDVQHISNEAMQLRIDAGEDTAGCYTRVEWGTTYREAARDFILWMTDHLACIGPPDQVRIVFWFDN